MPTPKKWIERSQKSEREGDRRLRLFNERTGIFKSTGWREETDVFDHVDLHNAVLRDDRECNIELKSREERVINYPTLYVGMEELNALATEQKHSGKMGLIINLIGKDCKKVVIHDVENLPEELTLLWQTPVFDTARQRIDYKNRVLLHTDYAAVYELQPDGTYKARKPLRYRHDDDEQ